MISVVKGVAPRGDTNTSLSHLRLANESRALSNNSVIRLGEAGMTL